MAHYTLYSSSESCWLHTNTQPHPASLLSFPCVIHSFLSLHAWSNLISSQYLSLSFCLCQYLLFSSHTFHKGQGERCPLKVIAGLIKFPPLRKEEENVIKEKRWELERINLTRRPSTPGLCPSISAEENEKMQENIEESRNWMTGAAWWWKPIQHWSNEKEKRWERSEKMERENDRGNLLKIVSADCVIYLDVLCCFTTLFTKENCTNHKNCVKCILHTIMPNFVTQSES